MRAALAIIAGVIGCASPAPHPSKLEPALATLRIEPVLSKLRGAPAQASPKASNVITVSAVGDCALGDLQHGAGAPGSMSAHLETVDDPMGYPFSRVRDVLARDDLSIGNLEGVLTARSGFQNDVFSIRGKPEWATMLVRGSVEVVNVANNHSHDYGETGHQDTKEALTAAGVAYFGRGTVDRRRVKGVEIVNLGYLGGPGGTLERMVRDVRREKRRDNIVIVSFHWGVEGFYALHPEQWELGRAAIDAGAELVLGHHPHVLQGIETYRGRHIVYSLGNFVFGANSTPGDTDSLIYQERFHLEGGAVARVEQLLIPVRFSGNRRTNDFRPMLLEGAERERVLAKVAELSRPQSGGAQSRN